MVNARGGYVSAHYGWRWIFWGLSCVQTVVVIASLLFLPETGAPIILDWKTKRLRKEGRKDVISPMETGHTSAQIFAKYLLRPFKVFKLMAKLTKDALYKSNRLYYGCVRSIMTYLTEGLTR
jgi:MFS family permease